MLRLSFHLPTLMSWQGHSDRARLQADQGTPGISVYSVDNNGILTTKERQHLRASSQVSYSLLTISHGRRLDCDFEIRPTCGYFEIQCFITFRALITAVKVPFTLELL